MADPLGCLQPCFRPRETILGSHKRFSSITHTSCFSVLFLMKPYTPHTPHKPPIPPPSHSLPYASTWPIAVAGPGSRSSKPKPPPAAAQLPHGRPSGLRKAGCLWMPAIVSRNCAVQAGLEPAQGSYTKSRKTSSVSLKVPTKQLGAPVFGLQVCLLFSESVFIWGKSTNKNKNEFLWEYLRQVCFCPGFTSALCLFFKNVSDSSSLKEERRLLFKN